MDRDDLRIGDAEREQTMAALREHFAQGRLTHDELDERLDQALAARTGRDLAQVTADLPGHDAGPRHDLPGAYDWRESAAAHHKQVMALHHAHREMRHRMHRMHRARREMRPPWAGPTGLRHHHGPHPIVGVLFLVMVVGLVFGGFGIFKVLLAVWLGAMLFSLVRRRFRDRR
ncbi:MAG TPA: DUF1707 domain-containing protein [Nonomuraea sp.]|nr:DUF1707 domain-containing protein [Nonomuraea sp.]